MPVVSARQQAELGTTRGSSQSVHSIRRAFQMYGGASEGDALRRLMRRVPSTSTWVHLSPRRGGWQSTDRSQRGDSAQLRCLVVCQVYEEGNKQDNVQMKTSVLDEWRYKMIRVHQDRKSPGGGRKGSNQRDLNTVEICWGLKLNFLKVTFILHGARCCILPGRFYFVFLEGLRRVHLGGVSDSQPSHSALVLPLVYHPSACKAAALTIVSDLQEVQCK